MLPIFILGIVSNMPLMGLKKKKEKELKQIYICAVPSTFFSINSHPRTRFSK